MIAPRDDSPTAQTAFAAVRDYYGLNRQELRRVRWRVYRDLETFRDVLVAGGLPEPLRRKVTDLVRAMMAAEAEFAGMVRYFVQVEWGLDLD